MKYIHRKIIFLLFAILSLPVIYFLFLAGQMSEICEKKFNSLAKWAAPKTWEETE